MKSKTRPIVCRTFLALVISVSAGPLLGQSDAAVPTFNANISTMALQPDGKVLAAGAFTNINGLPRNFVARFSQNGVVDAPFVSEPNGFVLALGVQRDGKLILGGQFSTLGTKAIAHLGRLDASGAVETGFNPNPNDNVWAICQETDGKILVGGMFNEMNGVPRNYLARLNQDGSLEAGFNPAPSYYVSSIVLQPDRKILVGGFYTAIGTQTNKYFVRLNQDGTLDSPFNPSISGPVHAAAVQPDGKILVGGDFESVRGQSQVSFARLNTDGTLDASFSPGLSNGTVWSIVLQADGKIIAGGSFTNVKDQQHNRIARFNSDGTLDQSFTAGAGDEVFSMALQADGKLWVAGLFTNFMDMPRGRLARITNSAPVAENLRYTGSSVSWLRSGPLAELRESLFETSSNGVVWTSMGKGIHTPTGWDLPGVTVSAGHLLRGIGYVTGCDSVSSWYVQDSIQVSPVTVPLILVNDGSFGFQGDHFGFNVVKGVGDRVIVQGSTNLINWDNLSTNAASVDKFYYSDYFYTNHPYLYYRVELVQVSSVTVPAIVVNDGNFGFQGDHFGFNVVKGIGNGVIVQGTTNLINWDNLSTNTASVGKFYFSDYFYTNKPHRYYRVELIQVPVAMTPVILVNDGNFGFQGDHFGFNVAKGVGDGIIVQGSANLVNWANLSTNHASLETVYFSDFFYTNYPHRYYRAKLE